MLGSKEEKKVGDEKWRRKRRNMKVTKIVIFKVKQSGSKKGKERERKTERVIVQVDLKQLLSHSALY